MGAGEGEGPDSLNGARHSAWGRAACRFDLSDVKSAAPTAPAAATFTGSFEQAQLLLLLNCSQLANGASSQHRSM